MPNEPPIIFSQRRKQVREERAAALLERPDSATFLLAHMAEEVHERLAFIRHQPSRILVEGFDAAGVAEGPWTHPLEVRSVEGDFEHALVFEPGAFDLVTSINS